MKNKLNKYEYSTKNMTIHTYIKDVSELVLIDDLVKIVNRYSFYSTSTLLIDSCKKGQLNIVKYLVEHGADITDVTNQAIQLAAYYGHVDVVKYLAEQDPGP